jgi:hypothetical protein
VASAPPSVQEPLGEGPVRGLERWSETRDSAFTSTPGLLRPEEVSAWTFERQRAHPTGCLDPGVQAVALTWKRSQLDEGVSA